ncbi:MAG: sugar transferase [Planctomycetales bacterium]|nr:sugar transferase [Planctomycetales bacterium]
MMSSIAVERNKAIAARPVRWIRTVSVPAFMSLLRQARRDALQRGNVLSVILWNQDPRDPDVPSESDSVNTVADRLAVSGTSLFGPIQTEHQGTWAVAVEHAPTASLDQITTMLGVRRDVAPCCVASCPSSWYCEHNPPRARTAEFAIVPHGARYLSWLVETATRSEAWVHSLVGPWHSGASEIPVLPLEPVFHVRSPRWKRISDIVLSLLLLAALAPLFLAISLWIKLTSCGPVFFRQSRYGVLGTAFQIYKFRTMHPTVDGNDHAAHLRSAIRSGGALSKIDHSRQLIPGGRLLRSLAIDELPQLFNVLRGEMSLVGPRPDVLPLGEYKSWHLGRFDVLPGLTGLWQVSGKNRTTFAEMIDLDLGYIRQQSFLFDAWIAAKTVPSLINQACQGTD